MFVDSTDSIQALLTPEGRNAEARASLGQIAYKFEGVALGRGGYDMSNPVKIVPFTSSPVLSSGYVDIIDNDFETGDAFVLNGVPFVVDITSNNLADWNKGLTAVDSAFNLATAINKSTNANILNVVGASPSSNRVHISALNAGLAFDNISMSTVDNIVTNFSLSGATLSGATSIWLIDQVYPIPPALAPLTVPFEQPNLKAVSMMLRLDKNDCLYGLGEIGIMATILYSSVSTYEVGHTFMMATGRFPIQAKTDKHVYIMRIIVQY